jgi:hypothetical protein
MTKLSFAFHGQFTFTGFAIAREPCLGSANQMLIMKLKKIIGSIIIAALFAGCASEKGEHESQANLMAEAKVTRADAEHTALDKVPGGQIKEGELERENGKLIWSFDIATPGTKDITEVGVDAITGRVVSVARETAKDEAKEKKSEKEEDEKDEKK